MTVDYYWYYSKELFCSPRTMKRYKDGKVSSCATVEGYGEIVEVMYAEIVPVLVEAGDYWNPPCYDMDIIGRLVIRPILKYSKRGN